MQIDTKASNTSAMRMHSLKQKHKVVGKIEEMDLGVTDIILFSSSTVLNSEASNKLAFIMRPNPNNEYLNSDPQVDEQMMIKLQFRDPVSLTHIVIRADHPPTNKINNIKSQTTKDNENENENKSNNNSNNNNNSDSDSDSEEDDDDDDEIEYSGPKLIKIFSNKPELDFTDAEDTPPNQSLVFTKKDLEGNKIALKSLKFQRCNSIQIFIVENQDETNVTFINRVGLIGRLTKQYHTDYMGKN